MSDMPLQIMRGLLLGGAGQMAGLLFARLLPIIAFTPLFGGQATPRRFRFGLTLVLSLGLLPLFAGQFGQSVDGVTYSILLGKEAVIGMTIAVFIVVLFEMLAAAGSLIDLSREATIGNLFDRLTRRQDSILAVFLLRLIIVLFFTIGGHRLLLLALGDSFAVINPYEAIPERFVDRGASVEMVSLLGDLFIVAVKLASPVIVMMLVLEVGLALVGRAAPQFDVFFFGRPIKGVLGLAILMFVLAYGFDAILADVLNRMIDWISGGLE